MSEQETCGPLYYRNRRMMVPDEDPEKIRVFALGMASGEAEKVHLRACPAAMFRPAAEDFDWLLEGVVLIGANYGLDVWPFLYEVADGVVVREVWMVSNDPWPQLLFQSMKAVKVNTPEWHRLRAVLCGIPEDRVDPEFHKRRGAPGVNDDNTE